MKKYKVLIALILVITTGYFIYKYSGVGTNIPDSNAQMFTSGSDDLKALISKKMEAIKLTLNPQATTGKTSKISQIGITSHHLPTAMDAIVSLYGNIYSSNGPRNTFVIIGPDHFDKCAKPITTTLKPYLTPFGKINANNIIINELIKGYASSDDSCLENEHSIKVQTIFIKYLYPDATIIPLAISSSAKLSDIEKLVQFFYGYKDETTIVVSVDFSHYRTFEIATKIDKESQNMINNLEFDNLDINHVDSPMSVKFAIMFAKKIGATHVNSSVYNSFDFTGESQNTTGYIDAIFYDN